MRAAHESRLSRVCRVLVSTFAAAIIAALFSSCQSAFTPVDLQKGDRCIRCKKPIEDKRFAGVIMFIGGEAMKFNDLGCLVAFHYGIDSATAHGVFVQDYRGSGWIEEENAFVVLHSRIETPRGSNSVACRSKSDADALQREQGGTVVSLSDVLKRETILDTLSSIAR